MDVKKRFIAFWDCKCVLLIDLSHERRIGNVANCCQLLDQAKVAFRHKGSVTESLIFLQYNTRLHTAALTHEKKLIENTRTSILALFWTWIYLDIFGPLRKVLG